MRRTRADASAVMVGRDRELHRLQQLAAAQDPQVALVAGEPGIGKTRLVHELLAALPDSYAVLLGRAEPSSLARPYEVLLDAVDGLPGLDEGSLEQLGDPTYSPVERLHTAVGIVDGVSAQRPSVVVFEDLHWVDSESAALFERLADHPGKRLLIGTYRPDEVTSRHPIAAVLDRMERRHSDPHVRLPRFTESDTAALVASVTGEPAPYRVVAALHQRTGGNPFFLEELLRGHRHAGIESLDEQPLPWSLAEVLRRNVDDLEPATRGIVEAAAVLGQRLHFDLLASVTGAGEDAQIGALRELVTRGILVEAGDDEFTFRHALLREAIDERLLGRQRRRLHETALEILLTSGESDPAMVAFHARAAGRYEDMVTAARQGAALYLSIGSPYQALRLAEMGLDETGEDAELLAAAARAAWLAGLVDDAADYTRRWLAEAATPTERADALYLMIRVAWETDAIEELDALIREVELLVADLRPGTDQARKMTAVAQAHVLRDDVDAALAWADRALALADEVAAPGVRLAAQIEKGVALLDRWSTHSEGRSLLRGLVDEAEQREEWVIAARALNALVQESPPASLREHAELLERMRVDAEHAGFERLAVAAYFQGLARVAMHEGDLGTAIEALEHGRDRNRRLQRRGHAADYHGVFVAGLYLEAGELDRAEEVLADLRSLPGLSPLTVPGLAFHLACRRNDAPEAERLLDEVFTALERQSWRSGSQGHDLISAALHVGLPLARVTRMRAELLDAHIWDDIRYLVDGQLAEASGDSAGALDHYRAVLGSSALPPALRGTAAVGAARCLLAAGDTHHAVDQVDAAGGLLAGWSGWRVAQLDLVRDQLGLAPTRDGQATTGPAALTRREREVALLVADGLTNAELARRLYISPKTAAVHVSSILGKLGVSGRADVGVALGTRTGKRG